MNDYLQDLKAGGRQMTKKEIKIKELQTRIDKAIEYIKNHQEKRTYYTPEQRWETTKYFVKGYYELLEILGDGNNE